MEVLIRMNTWEQSHRFNRTRGEVPGAHEVDIQEFNMILTYIPHEHGLEANPRASRGYGQEGRGRAVWTMDGLGIEFDCGRRNEGLRSKPGELHHSKGLKLCPMTTPQAQTLP